MPKLIDLTGKRFKNLTVIGRSDKHFPSGARLWDCICDCGNKCAASSWNLRNGVAISCGCSRKKNGSLSRIYNKEYRAWKQMLYRCLNKEHEAYENYGARGITVCDSWRTSFKNFLDDMGTSGKSLSLDRINNDEGYCKENCRWATTTQQNRNQRTTRKIELDGIVYNLSDLGRISGISPGTLASRIELGWNLKDALSRPVRKKRQ